MKRFRVCVYAIAKNEEKLAQRWMASMKEADWVVVTDTGSQDATVRELERLGATVYREVVQPWRFDVARNLSLSHVPKEADICVCTDLDEVFEPGWREKLEAAWFAGAKTGRYLYRWSLKPDGTPDTQFVYFKVHTKDDYRWVCPVHEHLQYTGETPEVSVFIQGMVLNHYPDERKSRGSYLPLLKLGVEEEPQNERMRYYLGREYLFAGEWQLCVDTLARYLALPTATWMEERCAAMRWMAMAYGELQRPAEAYRWYLRAVAEAPWMRDPYVEFAKAAYTLSDWETCLCMATRALAINEQSPAFVNMGYAWDHTPDDLAALACWHLGLLERAREHARRALALSPGDERLKRNLAFMEGEHAMGTPCEK